jgi:hypothetical protein
MLVGRPLGRCACAPSIEASAGTTISNERWLHCVSGGELVLCTKNRSVTWSRLLSVSISITSASTVTPCTLLATS